MFLHHLSLQESASSLLNQLDKVPVAGGLFLIKTDHLDFSDS
jgi:hypothetical protein